MKIGLAGHQFIDTIHLPDKVFHRAGGIWNCAHAFDYLGVPYEVMAAKEISYSDIYLKRDGHSKDSISKIKKIGANKFEKRFDWVHVAYLNYFDFDDLFYVKQNCNVLSGDICGDGSIEYKRCAKIDYLFYSKEEAPGDSLATHEISHSKSSCRLIKNFSNEYFEIFNSVQHNDIPILGAGDYFAAAFISYFFLNNKYYNTNETDRKEALRFASKITPTLIKNLNEF